MFCFPQTWLNILIYCINAHLQVVTVKLNAQFKGNLSVKTSDISVLHSQIYYFKQHSFLTLVDDYISKEPQQCKKGKNILKWNVKTEKFNEK